MPLSSYPVLSENLRPRRQEKTRDAIADLEEGLARGEIANAVYTRSKEEIGRAVEEAWEKAVLDRFIFNRDYRPGDEIEEGRLREVGYSARPAPHTMKSLRRKVAFLGDTLHKTVISGFLDELAPLMEQIAHGKDIAVKRLTGDAAAEARQAASPIARVSAPVLGRVETVLRNLTAEARDNLAAQLEARAGRILQKYLKAQEDFWDGPVSPGAAARGFGAIAFSTRIGNGKSVPDIRMLLDALLTTTRDHPGATRYQPKPDHQQRIHDMSMRRANEICADFIQRNLVKLAPVFEAKGAAFDLRVIANRVDPKGMNAHLRAAFGDGSSFDMKTSVVWSQNQFGTIYARFPVTFHDVILPDGERMSNPSEARMHEVFAIAPAAPQGPTPPDEDDMAPGF